AGTAAGSAAVPAAYRWPAGVKEGGRHGFQPSERGALELAAGECAEHLAGQLRRVAAGRVLVLGSEELMYAPLRIATELAARLACEVRYSTTTRSPVLVVDDRAYAIGSRLVFAAHDDPADGPGPRYAYNVGVGQFSDIVLVVDDVADTAELRAPAGLSAQLLSVADRLHVVAIPAYRRPIPDRLPEPLVGPAFGSYAADEVAWLLTDLSEVPLEVPIEEREEAIQAGVAHYAESLPIEYQPSAEYQRLYDQALAASAMKLAQAVGVVTEQVLAERGPGAVLVSLARAGTPIGALMRRWARLAHGLDLARYVVSIVRGRGIDTVALRYLAAQHDPAAVMFVDGWTGKGAIARELADAVAQANLSLGLLPGARFAPNLAVLADTGSCVSIFGTREDYLIPSACLNSTVSGLVSRTVLNRAHVGPDQFHGAKFYAHLAGADVSNEFLDAVTARFAEVRGAVTDQLRAPRADPTPTWAGWQTVQELSARYGIEDVNLVKPGVGETTRVLLRRVPWKVLMRRDAVAGLQHLVLLAAQRGVPVELVDELSYSCVGLIKPGFSREAPSPELSAVSV
ncbi:MAG: cysteine protease StiP domain-containing protein, partial [Jatrophihabitans sp.]